LSARTRRKRIATRKIAPPRTAEDFFAQADADQETWNRVLRAIAKMRTDGLSLKKAAKEVGISPRTVTRRGGRTLNKGANGRYSVTRRDSLLRVVQVPTLNGSREVALRNSRHASKLGRYWAAVHKYLQTGDSSEIETFRGQHVKDANGADVPLLTNLTELNRLGSAGVLSFESLYARSA
jgi:hypothetical protein